MTRRQGLDRTEPTLGPRGVPGRVATPITAAELGADY